MLTLSMLLGVVAQRVEAQATRNVIGAIGGPNGRGAVLENPRHILVIGERIIVIERSEPFLKVFDLGGRMLQVAGRSGAGPGEFRLVYTTAYDPERRRLLAFDTPLGRVSHFEFSDTLRFVTSQSLPLQVESACFMGSRLFASARSRSGIIHELRGLGPEVQVSGSYGTASAPHPLSENALYQDYLVTGHLFCDESTRTLTLATSLTGFVHIVGTTDGAQRTIALGRYNPVEFSAAGNGLTLATPRSGSYDVVVGIRSAAGARVLTVGTTDSTHTGAGDYASYREIVLNRENAQSPRSQEAWRSIDNSNGRTVCYRTDPEPEIVIVSGPRCP